MIRPARWTAFALVFVLAGPQLASAQCPLTKIQLPPSPPLQSFGSSADLQGDRAVASTYDSTASTGAVFVMAQNSGSWSVETQLVAGDSVPGDYFGFPVRLSGDTVAAGASQGNGLNGGSGAVYVFRKSGGTWSLEAKVVAPDGLTGDRFGYGVALEGDVLVVGAPYKSMNAGAVYVFRRSGSTWSFEKRLTLDGVVYLGLTVALSGETILAQATDIGNNVGAGFVFTHSALLWTQQAELLVYPLDHQAQVGFDIALDGDTAVLGSDTTFAPGLVGKVWVFRRNGTIWSQEATLQESDPQDFDDFGLAVDVSGETVIVGADQHFGPGSIGGAAYVFQRNAGSWRQRTKIWSTTPGGGNDYFGSSVVVADGRILVSSPGDGPTHAGALFEYEPPLAPPITPFCFGDGSGASCPCGNSGAIGHGCANSIVANGALLDATGIGSVCGDTLALDVRGLPPTASVVFVSSDTAGAPAIFGDGLGCLSGSRVRIGSRAAVTGSSTFPGPGQPNVSAASAVPAAGATRFYQAWYRNQASFCTSSAANASNGVSLTWIP